MNKGEEELTRTLLLFLHEWYTGNKGNKVKHILFEVLKETGFKGCLVGKTEVQRCYSSFSV